MVEVDPYVLRAVAEQTSRVHDDLQSEWRDVERLAAALFGGSWRGAAARSYAEPWSRCGHGFEQILSSLAIMGHAVAAAGEGYQNTDAASSTSTEISGAGILDL